MQIQITPKRALAAVGLVLVYILLSVWMVRRGQWPVAVGFMFVFAGVLLGLGVALARRRPSRDSRTQRP
jgi:membrane protein implicated in regulation of membrane protease activity